MDTERGALARQAENGHQQEPRENTATVEAVNVQEWEQRWEKLFDRDRPEGSAQVRQSEGECPEGIEAVRESVEALATLRELRTEIIAMRQEIARDLSAENISDEHRAVLRDISNDLREFHHETWKEIAALEREQPGREYEARTIGDEPLLEGITDAIGDAAGAASQILDSVSEQAEKFLDALGDMIAPSAPTPEMIQGRKEGKEQKAEQQEIDAGRYLADAEYRRGMDDQERQREAQERERQYYDRQKRGDRER